MQIKLQSGSVLIPDPPPELIEIVLAADSPFLGLVASDATWYWTGTKDFDERWDDETTAERPYLFRSLKRCQSRCRKQGARWRPMVWSSGDFRESPIIYRYILMDGIRYPTNPRQ